MASSIIIPLEKRMHSTRVWVQCQIFNNLFEYNVQFITYISFIISVIFLLMLGSLNV